MKAISMITKANEKMDLLLAARLFQAVKNNCKNEPMRINSLISCTNIITLNTVAYNNSGCNKTISLNIFVV